MSIHGLRPGPSASGRVNNNYHPARWILKAGSSDSEVELPQPQQPDSLALDHLLHCKSRILRSKLEVLTSEIYARLTLWNCNLARIDQDKSNVANVL